MTRLPGQARAFGATLRRRDAARAILRPEAAAPAVPDAALARRRKGARSAVARCQVGANRARGRSAAERRGQTGSSARRSGGVSNEGFALPRRQNPPMLNLASIALRRTRQWKRWWAAIPNSLRSRFP